MAPLLLLLLLACGGSNKEQPQSVARGMEQGALGGCPETPNCVSSQVDSSDEEHFIEGLTLGDLAVDEARERLVAILVVQPRTEVLQAEGPYVHASFTSKVFGFVDDVELMVDAEHGVVQVRSASRVGHGDLGVNRKRVEHLRELWAP